MVVSQSDLMEALSKDVPTSNKPATVLGIAITFELLAVLAVSMRLYARQKRKQGFGLDDIFVVMASMIAITGTIIVSLMPSVGLGRHQLTLNVFQLIKFFQYTLSAVIAYVVSVSLVKISILFQYIRLSSHDMHTFRRICHVMIAICAAWGIFFFMVMILGCIPLEGYWNPLSNAKCIMFGSKSGTAKVQAYVAQSTSNLLLDLIVFGMPLYLFSRNPQLSTQSRLGLFGVLCLGSAVIIVAILRLASIVKHSLGLVNSIMDVTFYAPLVIIWSCVEANIAILSASIPVFWPMITELAFGKIMVSTEVEVRSDIPSARASYYARQTRQMSRSQQGTHMSDSRSDDDETELTQSLTWRNAYGKTEISRSSS